MVRPIWILLPLLTLVGGCAHDADMPEPATPHMESAPAVSSTVQSEREVIAVDSMPPPAAEPAAHRRLDHVVTLGETQVEPYAPTPSDSGGNGGVVINNNVNVNGSQPGYYGGYGYGGYGYGGYYGGSYGYGSRGTGRSRGGAGTSGGARTVGSESYPAAQQAPARSGTTPGVGGNWATVPSSGPRQMR